MLRVIINADDFGKNHKVNLAIKEEIEKGNITSTTIMANADGFDEAVSISKLYPHISYGVHLCLDEYKPLTTSDVFVKRGIVDGISGRFVKGKILKVKLDNELKVAIGNEWDSQIKRLVDAGLTPSHIDSHHHVHTIAGLVPVLESLMKKYGISYVRGCYIVTLKNIIHGYRHFQGSCLLKELVYLFLRYSLFLRRRKWMKEVSGKVKMTDFFCSASHFYDNKCFFERCRGIVVEIECHPGHKRYDIETKRLGCIKDIEKLSYKAF